MRYALHLNARVAQVATDLERALNSPGRDLMPSALAIARVEYPSLEAAPYLARIDEMGRQAARRVGQGIVTIGDAIARLNEYLFDEEGFSGNRETYDDPRNSFLNEVLDRRTGIPISLAVVYLEVGHRAGLRLSGVNFPGHFLLRATGSAGEDLIVDPFHEGAVLSEIDCRQLLASHVGDEAAFDGSLLAPATRHDIVVRMLVNLKRLYVGMRSFPQARFISTLLLAVDPSALGELRDRGLLAYHLEDYTAALKDLEEYLRLAPDEAEAFAETEESDEESETDDETPRVIHHVKALRRRVASFN